MNTYTTTHCAYCNRPVVNAVWVGSFAYHLECTRGPSFQPPTWSLPVSYHNNTNPLTEERVREIVLEEIQKYNGR